MINVGKPEVTITYIFQGNTLQVTISTGGTPTPVTLPVCIADTVAEITIPVKIVDYLQGDGLIKIVRTIDNTQGIQHTTYVIPEADLYMIQTITETITTRKSVTDTLYLKM